MSSNALPLSYTGTARVCACNGGGVATALGGHCACARGVGEGGARGAGEGLTQTYVYKQRAAVGKGVRSAFASAHDRCRTKIEILKAQKHPKCRELAHGKKS